MKKINQAKLETSIYHFSVLYNELKSKYSLSEQKLKELYILNKELKAFTNKLLEDLISNNQIKYSCLLGEFIQIANEPSGDLLDLDKHVYLEIKDYKLLGKLQKIYFKLDSGKWLKIYVLDNS